MKKSVNKARTEDKTNIRERRWNKQKRRRNNEKVKKRKVGAKEGKKRKIIT